MLEGSEFMQWQNLDKVDQLNFDAASDIGFGIVSDESELDVNNVIKKG